MALYLWASEVTYLLTPMSFTKIFTQDLQPSLTALKYQYSRLPRRLLGGLCVSHRSSMPGDGNAGGGDAGGGDAGGGGGDGGCLRSRCAINVRKSQRSILERHVPQMAQHLSSSAYICATVLGSSAKTSIGPRTTAH